ICVGYSLSASMLEWISERVRYPIKLGIAIDPTKLFASALWNDKLGAYTQRAPNFDKVISFYHKDSWGWTPGGALYVGNNVEAVEINVPHLVAQALPSVWAKIENSIGELG